MRFVHLIAVLIAVLFGPASGAGAQDDAALRGRPTLDHEPVLRILLARAPRVSVDVLEPTRLEAPGVALVVEPRTLVIEAVKGGWSVREVEKRARGADPKGSSKHAITVDPLIRELEVVLRDSLVTRVSIKQKRGGKGSIDIQYHGAEDFERVFALITGREVSDVVK